MLRYLSTPLKTTKSFSYFVLSRNFSKYFVKSHEWISIEKGVATLGISDYAQSELGEIVHVDMPKIGDKFKSGDSIGAVESVKTAADIYAPVEGVIGEINDKLGKTPSLLNSHAESQGWLVKMKVEEEKVQGELSKMMNEEQYQKYIADLKK
jgi:glycine cleavage system H protein